MSFFGVTSERMHSIDVLRGVAALSVMLCHVYPHQATGVVTFDALAEFIRFWVLQVGQTGVNLFFIISGFVIPSSLMGLAVAPLRRFWISRVMRLYPAYWLSLAFAVAVAGMATTGPQLIANVTMLQRYLGQPSVVGVYWTLAVEMLFYVLITGGFALGLLARPRWASLAFGLVLAFDLAGGVAYWAFGIEMPLGTAMYITLMLFGTWLRLDAHRGQVAAVTALLLVVLVATCWLFYAPDRFERPWTAHYAGFAIAVVTFAGLYSVRRIAWRPLVWLGEASYSIYLLHMPLAFLAERMLPSSLPPLVGCALILSVTLVVAGLVHDRVERPFIRLGRRLSARLTVEPRIPG